MNYVNLDSFTNDDDLIVEVRRVFPQCPNPDQYPKVFEWYCRLYIFYQRRKQRYGT